MLCLNLGSIICFQFQWPYTCHNFNGLFKSKSPYHGGLLSGVCSIANTGVVYMADGWGHPLEYVHVANNLLYNCHIFWSHIRSAIWGQCAKSAPHTDSSTLLYAPQKYKSLLLFAVGGESLKGHSILVTRFIYCSIFVRSKELWTDETCN